MCNGHLISQVGSEQNTEISINLYKNASDNMRQKISMKKKTKLHRKMKMYSVC